MIHDHPFTTPHRSAVARPYLTVALFNPLSGIRRKVMALIDTGADECALPALYAPLLGHELSAGLIKEVGTGNGITTAYSHTVCIEIFSFSSGDVQIDFMPNLTTPLLGVKSFLSNFILEIDYCRKVFSLTLPAERI